MSGFNKSYLGKTGNQRYQTIAYYSGEQKNTYNQRIYKIHNYTFFRSKIETSGNLFQLLGQAGNLNTNQNNFNHFQTTLVDVFTVP